MPDIPDLCRVDQAWTADFSAFASWSGQDVDLNPQRIPSRREIASFTSIPSIRREIPWRFPLHPPTKETFFALLSTRLKWIFCEQTPFGLYSIFYPSCSGSIIANQKQKHNSSLLDAYRNRDETITGEEPCVRIRVDWIKYDILYSGMIRFRTGGKSLLRWAFVRIISGSLSIFRWRLYPQNSGRECRNM